MFRKEDFKKVDLLGSGKKNTKIYKALKGVRGRKSADIPAIEKLIVNFSHLIMDKWMFIKEVEM